MSQSRLGNLHLQDKEAEEIKKNKEKIEVLNNDPLGQRRFTTISTTSSCIQVEWDHPSSLKDPKDKKNLYYVLEYGIGVKVNN